MQDFVHFEFVARQSVGLGDVRRIGNEGRIMDALARASATDVVAPLPAGLETQLGREYEDGVELSAGQRQKLALGQRQRGHRCCSSWTSRRRASTHTPSTRSSIDTPGRRSARAVRWARSRSWCRTGFSTVRMADLVVVLDAGRVAQAGTHEELSSVGGPYRELFELQRKAYR